MGEIMKHFDDFEEKTISSLANFANKFTYFGYINKNEKYPVFVDEKKKIYIKAQNPRTFLFCVKRMDEDCAVKEMEDMLDFKYKYEKLCKVFNYDKKIAKSYLQKSVDHILSQYKKQQGGIEQ